MNSVPTLVRFVHQRYPHGDCGVRTAAMLAGVSYESALIEAAKVKPNVLEAGLTWPQLRAVLRRLKIKTKILYEADLSEMTGLLHVTRVALGLGEKSDHVVFLWEGRIIEGNGEMWMHPDDYVRHYGYEAKGLLVIRED